MFLSRKNSQHYCFASHLLQANYDIRTIQELLRYSDLKTTMIYTHTVKSITKKEAKSPLDLCAFLLLRYQCRINLDRSNVPL